MTFKREYLALPKPIAAQYATPSGVVCVQVVVPDGLQHLALLQGLMATLTDANAWQGDDADRAALAAIWQNAYTLTDWEGCDDMGLGYQNHQTLWYRFANVYIGNPIATTITATNIWGHWCFQSPAANGDAAYIDCNMLPGNYRARLSYTKAASAGKISINLSNETTLYTEFLFVDLDMYASTNQVNQLAVVDFEITEEVQRCYFIQSGKNASSSGYNSFLTVLDITRTDV